jgi:mRNA-degrading endonuclease RelE of RelBE toxin-antitoxin system
MRWIMKVELSDQVLRFVQTQAPQPRRKLRLALRGLESERGDIKDLQGPLSRYSRLRVGAFRVLFIREPDASGVSCIRCIFAERRDTVYTVFSHMLKRDILG